MRRALFNRGGELLANSCLLISFHFHHCKPHLCLNLVIEGNAVTTPGPSLEAQDIDQTIPVFH
jgi:hypothetical protein